MSQRCANSLSMNSDSQVKSESLSNRSDYTSIVINFSDGVPFDDAFNEYNISRREVRMHSAKDCEGLIHAIVSGNKSYGNERDDESCYIERVAETISAIHRVGYAKVTVNFASCSGYANDMDNRSTPLNGKIEYTFCDYSTSAYVIRVIKLFLAKGSQVICSDSALKALISQWDKKVFGMNCPFVNTGILDGNMKVIFGINECKECCFPQLSAIGELAIRVGPITNPFDDIKGHDASINISNHVSQMVINTNKYTMCYKIADKIDPALTVKVMSIATNRIDYRAKDTRSLFRTDDFTELYGVKNAKGVPIHTIIEFRDMPGTIVVSSLHLTRLCDIETNSTNICQLASRVLNRERSEQICTMLCNEDCTLSPKDMCNIVAEIATCSVRHV
jgi:hypothetical protein